MKQKKSMKNKVMALGLGAMVVGSAGLVAANNNEANAVEDLDETEHEYGSYNYYDKEYEIWEQVEEIYEQHADEYDELEGEIDTLYEDIEVALEADNDPEILRLVKEIWAKEKEFEALDEKTGLADLFEELDELYEAWDEEEYGDWEKYDYDQFENSDNPEVQNILKQIENIEQRIESIETKNESAFEELYEQEEELFDKLVAAEQKSNNQAEIDRIEGQLEALEQKYVQLENKLGLTSLFEQIEKLEDKLYDFEED